MHLMPCASHANLGWQPKACGSKAHRLCRIMRPAGRGVGGAPLARTSSWILARSSRVAPALSPIDADAQPCSALDAGKPVEGVGTQFGRRRRRAGRQPRRIPHAPVCSKRLRGPTVAAQPGCCRRRRRCGPLLADLPTWRRSCKVHSHMAAASHQPYSGPIGRDEICAEKGRKNRGRNPAARSARCRQGAVT